MHPRHNHRPLLRKLLTLPIPRRPRTRTDIPKRRRVHRYIHAICDTSQRSLLSTSVYIINPTFKRIGKHTSLHNHTAARVTESHRSFLQFPGPGTTEEKGEGRSVPSRRLAMFLMRTLVRGLPQLEVIVPARSASSGTRLERATAEKKRRKRVDNVGSCIVGSCFFVRELRLCSVGRRNVGILGSEADTDRYQKTNL